MNCEYVQQRYGVPACIGRRVIADGEPGVIVEDKGAHIGILLDKDEPGTVGVYHPTWNMEYLGMGEVRELPARKRKAKERYHRYLEFGDGFESFIDYCRWDADPERSWN